MSNNRWFKSRKALWILVLLCVLGGVVMAFCMKTAIPSANDEDLQIQTEFCDLYYPSHWGEHLKIMQIEDTVQFWAVMEDYGLLPLLDIYFNSDEGDFYGMITAKDGTETSISLKRYAVEPNDSWSQEQVDMLNGMLDDFNGLLSKLPIIVVENTIPQEVSQESLEEEVQDPVETENISEDTQKQENRSVNGEIEIATPYGVLKYPDTWKGYLRLNLMETDVYTVEFYANVEGHPELHLFDIQIASTIENGIVLHTENEKTVSLNINVVQKALDQEWEDDDADIIYGMLDDINYLLSRLETD